MWKAIGHTFESRPDSSVSEFKELELAPETLECRAEPALGRESQ